MLKVINLREISREELVKELKGREGVRSTNLNKGEYFKIQAAGKDNSMDRHLKGYGPGVILEVTEDMK